MHPIFLYIFLHQYIRKNHKRNFFLLHADISENGFYTIFFKNLTGVTKLEDADKIRSIDRSVFHPLNYQLAVPYYACQSKKEERQATKIVLWIYIIWLHLNLDPYGFCLDLDSFYQRSVISFFFNLDLYEIMWIASRLKSTNFLYPK